MNTTQVGRQAEAQAVALLEARGFTTVTRNWRTRYCEIDVVAKRGRVVYFIEVKYRRQSKYGDGLDYITAAKLRRMTFAADVWVSQQHWYGNYQLAVMAIDGRGGAEFRLL